MNSRGTKHLQVNSRIREALVPLALLVAAASCSKVEPEPPAGSGVDARFEPPPDDGAAPIDGLRAQNDPTVDSRLDGQAVGDAPLPAHVLDPRGFSITTSPTNLLNGEPIRVAWTAPQGRPETDRLGLFLKSEGDDPQAARGWGLTAG